MRILTFPLLRMWLFLAIFFMQLPIISAQDNVFGYYSNLEKWGKDICLLPDSTYYIRWKLEAPNGVIQQPTHGSEFPRWTIKDNVIELMPHAGVLSQAEYFTVSNTTTLQRYFDGDTWGQTLYRLKYYNQVGEVTTIVQTNDPYYSLDSLNEGLIYYFQQIQPKKIISFTNGSKVLEKQYAIASISVWEQIQQAYQKELLTTESEQKEALWLTCFLQFAKVIEEKQWKNDVKHGEWVLVKDNGQLTIRQKWKEGIMVNETVYNQDGEVIEPTTSDK